MKMNTNLKTVGAFCAIFLMAMGGARAQILPAYVVGNTNPVTDVMGRNLPGTGNESNSAARVEIRLAGTNTRVRIVSPDPITGAADEAANPLLRASYMGYGVLGVNPGMFSESFNNRLPTVSTNVIWFFARVYDAPTVSGARYYADSAKFSDVAVELRQTITSTNLTFGAIRRIDGTEDVDSDLDGLPDWIEMDITGTDPNNPDTDGDGYDDGFEVVHDDYLHPNDVDPREIWIRAPEAAGDPPVLTGKHFAFWWAVPHVAYRLEFRPQWLDEEAYSNIWSGTAMETNLEVDVEAWVQTNSPDKGFFRWIIP